MKTKNKASGKANASSEGVKDPSDLPLKPVHTINWAKTHPTSDWVQEAAKHSLGVEDIQSLPKEKDAVLRAALTNYTKEQLVIAIVSAMGGNLPSEIPSSKEAAVTTLIDIIYKNKQHDQASSSAFASSFPATDGNAGDATPVGSVVTLSPAKRRTTTTSSSVDRLSCPPEDGLGEGWTFIRTHRKNGKGSDRFFWSPEGVKFRSLVKAQAHFKQAQKKQKLQSAKSLVDTDDSDDDSIGFSLAKANSVGSDGPVIDPFVHKERLQREKKHLEYYSSSDESVRAPGSKNKSKGATKSSKTVDAPVAAAASAAVADVAADSSDDDDDMWASDNVDSPRCDDAMVDGKSEEIIDVDADVSSYVPSSPKKKKAKSSIIVNPYRQQQQPVVCGFETPVKPAALKSNQAVKEIDDKDKEIALLKKQLLAFQSKNDAICGKEGKGELVVKTSSELDDSDPVNVMKSDDTSINANKSSFDFKSPSPGKWPSLDKFVNKKIESLSAPSKASNAVITVEVSLPITDLKTNEDVHLIIFVQSGVLSWFIKPEAVKKCAEIYLTQGLGGEVASVYREFTETSIRKVPYGPNVLHRRNNRPNDNGNLPYPTMKMITWLRVNKKGFGVDLYVKNFGQTLQAIFADCKPASYILNDHLSENAITLYDRFMQGLYRPAPEKKVPYEKTEELLEFFQMALEKTFKNGFKRIVTGISLDKYLPDYEIKNFLISLGYSSFEDVLEDEKKAIYRSTNFPDWESIEQEGFM